MGFARASVPSQTFPMPRADVGTAFVPPRGVDAGSGLGPGCPKAGPGLGSLANPHECWAGPDGPGWAGSFPNSSVHPLYACLLYVRNEHDFRLLRKRTQHTRTHPDHPDPDSDLLAFFEVAIPGPNPDPPAAYPDPVIGRSPHRGGPADSGVRATRRRRGRQPASGIAGSPCGPDNARPGFDRPGSSGPFPRPAPFP